ncbi:SPK domain-containing protein [Caenorhabditis elegans]|uniref:SPK domain-containing protein n=1 Tax=Caenorhabditis elegans TaxID=6239 RepID=O45063_CAEEL|nr:SPK domain-containing protein [Caenorhabditis elegans]CCD61331.1 SPK domain-containing protein [Caenorhabditis elegans]|eukprot:NP_500369.1 Uncharacterized protein CELE_B0212.3 [Caenorhabditis elegans]
MYNDDELTEFMDFLVEQTKDSIYPMVAAKVFKQFPNRRLIPKDKRYQRFVLQLAPKMNDWNNYSIEARIRLMYALRGKVEDDFLARIEAHGTVQLNEKQRISKFTANDGTFFLEDDRKRLSLDATRLEFVKLMGFLIEKTKDAVEPLPNTKLIFQEFSQIEPVKKPNDTDIMYKFRSSLAPYMDKWNDYSIEDRVRLMFALGGKIKDGFLRTIETHGTLQLDDKRRITKYVSNDGNFKLEGIRRNVHKKEATGPEYTRFMDFLIKTTKEAVEPMRVWLVHNEFKRQEGRKFSKSGYAKRFHKKLAPNMSKWTNYKIEERTRMMFAMKGKVESDFLAQIEESGKVQLDENHLIVKYTSKNRKIKLGGETRLVEKKKRKSTNYHKMHQKRRKIIRSVTDETSLVAKWKRKSDSYYEMYQKRRKIGEKELSDTAEVEEVAPYDSDYGNVYVENLEAEDQDTQLNPFNAMSDLTTDGPSSNAHDLTMWPNDDPKQEPVFENIFIQNQYFPPEIEEVPNQGVYHVEPETKLSYINTNPGSSVTESGGIKLHKFLNLLELILTSLESDTLDDLLNDIEGIRVRINDEILPPELVITALQTFLLGITRKSRSAASAENKSSHECLRIFKYSLPWLRSPLLWELQQRVEEEIESHVIGGKIILVADVQQGIRNILFAVSN